MSTERTPVQLVVQFENSQKKSNHAYKCADYL